MSCDEFSSIFFFVFWSRFDSVRRCFRDDLFAGRENETGSGRDDQTVPKRLFYRDAILLRASLCLL